jgi:hypothetical protein
VSYATNLNKYIFSHETNFDFDYILHHFLGRCPRIKMARAIGQFKKWEAKNFGKPPIFGI